MKFIQPRLRKPLGILLAGTLLAVAWLLRGGPSWYLSIVMEVSILVWAFVMYRRGGADTDEGALAGSRADERQQLISVRSRALAFNMAMVVTFLGLIIAIAAGADWWWPLVVILAVGGFGYLYGLSTYGVAQEGPSPDEAEAERSPGQPAVS
jgi:Ca2+/Na+ antiporter